MSNPITLHPGAQVWHAKGKIESGDAYEARTGENLDSLRNESIAWHVLEAHNHGTQSDENLHLMFDSITSHDITYVGIIQTARASGMKKFPIPYVLTNCHNSLCAVGGTINEDDHKFGLSAAKKYGGVYVPPNMAVIHSYNREMMAGCGKMILGSDSHTRYGAIGTLAIGEGGGELAKQLLGQTYDVKRPEVVGIVLRNAPKPWVGPQDVALQIVKAVYDKGFTKNKVMEFIGEGVHALPIEFRNGIDVMTTETTCLSSIWRTDDKVEAYLTEHGRPEDYQTLQEGETVCYDGIVEVDLDAVEPSIALPYHPSKVYTIRELLENPAEILRRSDEEAAELYENTQVRPNLLSKLTPDGRIHVEQGIIVGCSGGTLDNLVAAAKIVKGKSVQASGFNFSVYPGSQPIFLQTLENGVAQDLMSAGAVLKPAFCGPCFGAGDTPANEEFSIRHATRNFPNRDGSKPGEGQISMIALMDARSIAATAINGGYLTSAEDLDWDAIEAEPEIPHVAFDDSVYENTVVNCLGKADPSVELVLGPNIKDWPETPSITKDLLFKVASHIDDPVTTTDELIPSGETSSYRSNPLRLAEFALSRKDPDYVPRSKAIFAQEQRREAGESIEMPAWLLDDFASVGYAYEPAKVGFGSAIYANRPGDGSAREQAASCQRVLGGWANFAQEYATKRYRSNLINWGILPFLVEDGKALPVDAYVLVEGIQKGLKDGETSFAAKVFRDGEMPVSVTLQTGDLSEKERSILLKGSLINENRA